MPTGTTRPGRAGGPELLEAGEVHDVPLAAPRDQRGDLEVALLAVEIEHDACTIHAPVAELVRLLVRIDPARAIVRHVHANELRAVSLFAEALVERVDVALVGGDEAALPIGLGIRDRLHLLVG